MNHTENSYNKILKKINSESNYKYIPQRDEIFWYVNQWTKSIINIKCNSNEENTLIKYFKTKEEAEKYLEFLLAEDILRKEHFNICGNWKPDWKDEDSSKYFPYYSHEDNEFQIDYYFRFQHNANNFFYFETHNQCKEFIDRCIKELDIYFGITK